ncbi:hypothetical protein [Micromonospora radicis]|uniref:Uncharacterized protein n=1 Tax=Micromonospora radicis TaxID=1894971 RepID=A0A418MZ01_9ACTN|nr:hypothetical protein [Micromonospora radicis]RIV40587.1 hypothetical protein D2L64_02865 [Micromonospora radicis]
MHNRYGAGLTAEQIATIDSVTVIADRWTAGERRDGWCADAVAAVRQGCADARLLGVALGHVLATRPPHHRRLALLYRAAGADPLAAAMTRQWYRRVRTGGVDAA